MHNCIVDVAAFNGMQGMRMGPMGQPMFGGMGQQQQFAVGAQFYPAPGMNPAMMGGMQGMAPTMYPMQVRRVMPCTPCW